MLLTLLGKALRDQRRALVGWSVGVAALVTLEAALWPSVRGMPGLQEMLANYPEAMRTLFKLEDLATGTGFMNAELFSLMLPLLFLVFSIGRGARAIAGEEEAGTLEVLLVTPVSTTRLALAQGAVLAASLTALGAVLFATTMVTSVLFGLGIQAAQLAWATVAVVALGIEFGWLALAIGAATGRRAWAIAGASVAAVLAYVLYLAGELVSAIEPWQVLSPFQQALAGGPLGGGARPAFLWLPAVGAAVVAAALPLFGRRDIATP
jgi:ABC-2 type transport system permease protein